jgi:uncharacterized protein (DUF1015 family)
MPVMPGAAPTDPTVGPRKSLRLREFAALRYAPDVVDLAAATSPPYDVIERSGVAELEAREPHNVVRLILPSGAGDDRYAHAQELMRAWCADGVLRRDDGPALYVYEQRLEGVAQRGLIGALELRDPEDRVVLPHEDVMPWPVADRLALMQATNANLEPILLVYEGGGRASDVVDRVAGGEPLAHAVTEDGGEHRLWRVTEPADLRAVDADLAPRQAMIADGHHRYASYLRLQAHHRADGPGPWDAGLALLVDSTRHPLHVRAIHRVVLGLAADEAAAATGEVFAVSPAHDADDALRRLAEPGGRHRMALHGRGGTWVVEDPDPARVDAALDPGRPARWRRLDAAVLHGLLIEHLWRADDAAVAYHHDAAAAVEEAERTGGTAVLLRPVELADVIALAAMGERMPRKSTSFGPKPRTGIVLRELC